MRVDKDVLSFLLLDWLLLLRKVDIDGDTALLLITIHYYGEITGTLIRADCQGRERKTIES